MSFDQFQPQGPRVPVTQGQETSDIEQLGRVVNPEQTGSREADSKKTKLSVLIGSGLIQLPIWGMSDQLCHPTPGHD